MSSELEFAACLVPVEQVAEIFTPRQGLIRERFDRYTFASESAHPDRVAVTVDHDDDHRVGRLLRLEPKDGWWICRCVLESGTVEPGEPVSIEFTPLHKRHYDDHVYYQCARLDVVTLLKRGWSSYWGARVTAVHRARPVIAEPSQRASSRKGASPRGARSSPATASESEIIGGEIIHRKFGVVTGVR
jgi:hypothetical protein